MGSTRFGFCCERGALNFFTISTPFHPLFPIQGYRLGCVKGAKYGFPVVDVKATLLDGKYHDVDSSADTFKLAAMESFRDAQARAGVTILEPIMNVMVHAPGQYLGDLTRDVSRRRDRLHLQVGPRIQREHDHGED